MYDQQREDQGNNLLGNVVIGAGLLGAGALGPNYARSVAKNRVRKAQVNVSDNIPRSGQGGAQMMDLSALPEQTKAGVYKRAAASYPDPGVGKDVQYRNPGSGGTDLSMLITDERTGEVYRRGGGQSLNQVRVNQDPGVNLAKQNLGGQSAPTITDNSYLASIRQSNTRLGDLTAQSTPGFAAQQDYVRNRIADSLEAPAGSFGPNVQLRDLPSATQLVKSTGSSGPKLAGYSEGPVDAQDRKHIEASRRDMPSTMVEVREASAPFARDAANEARLTANDQKDLEIIKLIQRNEDVDLTRFNEDVLDRRVADARDYLIPKEVDTTFDYTAEAERQAADLAAGLERISNDPRRKAAEGIISELQTEGRAERDLARFQAEGEAGGELAGLKAEDNIRQRSQQQGSRSMTGEQLEEVLLGESKVIDSSMRGRALRGGKINEEGNQFVEPGTITYVGEGGAETADFRDASTGVRSDIPFVASGPKTPEGAASNLASEAIRKKYLNQRPEPLGGPAADVARSMEVMRQGMEAEPREVRPSTEVPTINRGGYADGEAVIAVAPETAFTGDAADAAGPVLFTGKNKRDSAVVGTSPSLTQGGISFVPEVAEYNERMAQNFLNRAIDGGLTEKQTETYVYEPAKVTRVVEPAGPTRQMEMFEVQPVDMPYVSTGKAAGGPEGADASQRLGYTRYNSESNPLGTPSTGAMTVGINYAELPQSTAYRPSDVGRTLPNLSANPAAISRTMNFADPEAPTRTVYRDTRTGHDYVAHPMQLSQVPEVKGPAPIAPDAGPVRMSVPPDPQTRYAPQALAGRQATVVYPRMRGESLNPTGAMINNPDLRGGPVKFEGRERREDEYVRPISERLGRGDTMQRFPLIRRG